MLLKGLIMAFLRLCAAVLAAACSASAVVALADDGEVGGDYFWCIASTGNMFLGKQNKLASDIFSADSSDKTAIQNDWFDYVKKQYETPTEHRCYVTNDFKSALKHKDQALNFHISLGFNVIFTGWEWKGRERGLRLIPASASDWRPAFLAGFSASLAQGHGFRPNAP